MKSSLLIFAFGIGCAATTVPSSLTAQDEPAEDTTATVEDFELSLFPGAQLRGEGSAIRILRLGLYNKNLWVSGLDIGVVNRASDIRGFQLGLVNWAEKMHGVQVGLINIISGNESLPFLPFVNWSF